jgi:predicted RNA-binding protein associated with RNAse of E/G family
MADIWKSGEIITWRGIYRSRVWHAQTVVVVNDSSEELAVALLPGTECVAPEVYLNGKNNSKRRWDFKKKTWSLQKYNWHTNRLLMLLEPHKYYSTMYFWNEKSNEFQCYYMNFQLPFQRNERGIGTLDLDLDLIINPDLSHEWKDIDDYQKAIEHEIILPEWIQGIEKATEEIFDRLEKRQYPFDGSWLDWMPDPDWSPPTLPSNWDKI